MFSAGRPASQFKSSALGGFDVSLDPWEGDPLILVKGDGGTLSLKQDAIVSLPVIDTSRVCLKFKAAGSGGFIDCDGGTAAGVAMTVDSHGDGANDDAQYATGQGGDAGPGAALLTMTIGLVNLPAGSPFSGCASATYAEVPAALTTGAATGSVLNPKQGGGTLTASDAGENFDCASFTTEDGAGKLVVPLAGLDTIIGDSVNMLVLSDRDE